MIKVIKIQEDGDHYSLNNITQNIKYSNYEKLTVQCTLKHVQRVYYS